jgi:hypothetical protein
VLNIPNPKIIDAKMDNGIKIKIFVLRPIKKIKRM